MLTHLLYLLKALQSAVTHFVWQVGGGLCCNLNNVRFGGLNHILTMHFFLIPKTDQLIKKIRVSV